MSRVHHTKGRARPRCSGECTVTLATRRRKFGVWSAYCLIMKASLGGNLQGSLERMRRLQTSNLKRDILPHDIAATLATTQLGLIAKQPRKRHVRRSDES
jgi:hypothetical protein